MLVCHCNGVSERAVRKVIRDGAQTVGEVSRACGAGSCCGGCVGSVRDLLRNEAAHRAELTVVASTPAPPTNT